MKLRARRRLLTPGKAPGNKAKLDEWALKLLEEDLHARPAATYERRADLLYELLVVRARRILEEQGHEVLATNARKVRLTFGEARKTDRIGAEKPARSAQLGPKLLSSIKHRGESSQCLLALVHSRDPRWWGRGRSSSPTFEARSQDL